MTSLALVGAGHIHTPGFVQKMAQRDVDVAVVWDHDAKRAASHAQTLNARVAATPKDAIGTDGVDAVVICSETNRHEELVGMAVEARKGMFVEKPLGYAAKDAYAMAQAIEDAGLLFQTGYFMRGTPVHQFLKQHINRGDFGTITRARHSNCHKGSLAGWFDTEWRWMADPAVAGCGAFGDLGTHSLDILLWLFGEVTKVTAEIRPVTGRYGDCDETGEGLLVFRNGVIATLAAGWVDLANPISVLVSGTEAHAHVHSGKLFVKGDTLNPDANAPFEALPSAAPAGFDLFLDVLQKKADGQALVSAREAAQRSAVMDALYQAHAQQTWITPDWR